jgi:soluble lytic murein transglycosylase-like protein
MHPVTTRLPIAFASLRLVRWVITLIALLLAVGYTGAPEERRSDQAPAPAPPIALHASQPFTSANSALHERRAQQTRLRASSMLGASRTAQQRSRAAKTSRIAARLHAALRRHSRRSGGSLGRNVRWAADSIAELGAASVRRFDRHAREAGRQHAMPVDLIRAVILVESRYNPRAVSPAGAMGLMQLMPGTASDLQVRNAFNARENVRGGAQLLRTLSDRFDDMALVIAAYNAGPNAVRRYGGVPPYAETRRYVGRVLGAYKHYRSKGWRQQRAAR